MFLRARDLVERNIIVRPVPQLKDTSHLKWCVLLIHQSVALLSLMVNSGSDFSDKDRFSLGKDGKWSSGAFPD